MSIIQAILLGIIQGITEFFPISSSAHLKFFKTLLHIQENSEMAGFDLACHLGTTLAILFYLRKKIISLFTAEREKVFYIFLAILPLFPFYFLLKPVRIFMSNEHFCGIFLILTAVMLFISSSLKERPLQDAKSHKSKIKDALFIGLMQSLALIPGISRSGSTIFGGCIRGWKIQEAILFSFLLSVPTILGGSFLELIKIDNLESLPIGNYIAAFATSFVIGFIAIRFIFSLTKNKHLRPFAVYCLLIGFFLLIYFNI